MAHHLIDTARRAVQTIAGAVTEARERNRTIRLAFRYPPHPDRATDPQYWRFTEHRKQLAATDSWYCHSCGRREPDVALELHHKIPFALVNGVDWGRLAAAIGRPPFTEDQFWDFIHRDQVEPLCRVCHTIRHAVPEPVHRALLVWDRTKPYPVRVRTRRTKETKKGAA